MVKSIQELIGVGNENNVVNNRYDFFILVSDKGGNINGDPDNGNNPRFDSESEYGYATDASIKYHIKQAVKQIFGDEMMIDPSSGSIERVMKSIPGVSKAKNGDKDKSLDKDKKEKIVQTLCNKYFDARVFGCVTCHNNISFTGPAQISNGLSLNKIRIHDASICRCIPNEEKKEENGGSQFGDKPHVVYGLYRFTGEIHPSYAKITGMTNQDIIKLITGIDQAYSLWSSAQKGEAETVKIVVFKHDSEIGNAKKSVLFSAINARLREGVTNPMDYNDYVVEIDETKIPEGVTACVIG